MNDNLFFVWVGLALSAFIIIGAVTWCLLTIRFLSGATRREGIVVGLKKGHIHKVGVVYFPVIEYAHEDNKLRQWQSNVGTSQAFTPQKNTKVILYFSNGRMDEPRIGNFANLWFGPSVLLMIGVTGVIVCSLLLVNGSGFDF